MCTERAARSNPAFAAVAGKAKPRPGDARRGHAQGEGASSVRRVPPRCATGYGRTPARRLDRGFSLIEVVLFILLVGVALASVLQVYRLAAVGSAEPLVRRQALAVAQSLIEEIATRPFGDDASDNPALGGFAGPYTPANRQLFDDVDDYHGLAMDGILRLDNTPLAGLEGYRARVEVSRAALGGVPDTHGLRIRVTVTPPSGAAVVLETYRTNH